MKISSFPDNRLILVNAAIADFLKTNNLPVVQITGPRAARIVKWFHLRNKIHALNQHISKDQRIQFTWYKREYKYMPLYKTLENTSISTWADIKDIGSSKLPDQQLAVIANLSKMKISVYDGWVHKYFTFMLESK